MASSVLSFCLLFITVYTAGRINTLITDQYTLGRLNRYIEYIESFIYDKLEIVRFDSNVGKYVGYTELGVKNAERWNSGQELVQAKNQKEIYCKPNIDIYYPSALTKSGE
uniref:MHC class II beta chain N-terminal domain-containing protein n=1 Tax=Monopterus albus TaxID=43700 RepID=A0A3Q3Q836_MONAL